MTILDYIAVVSYSITVFGLGYMFGSKEKK